MRLPEQPPQSDNLPRGKRRGRRRKGRRRRAYRGVEKERRGYTGDTKDHRSGRKKQTPTSRLTSMPLLLCLDLQDGELRHAAVWEEEDDPATGAGGSHQTPRTFHSSRSRPLPTALTASRRRRWRSHCAAGPTTRTSRVVGAQRCRRRVLRATASSSAAMRHPEFKWDDVKVDKHRENYLGHSVKAPVGRWQKGKDLFWYTKDKKSDTEDALKEEIRRVKEEEEQAMREALGLAPKRSNRPQGNRLDKHEYAELIKRGSTAEDLGAGHAEAAQVQGLGLYKAPRDEGESSSFKLDPPETEMPPEQADPPPAAKQEDSEDDRKGKRRHEREERRGEKERKRGKHADGKERRRDKHERRHDSEDRSKHHRKDKQRRRHDSD